MSLKTAFTRSFERFVLLTLLGFAAFVAAPVLILLLLVSFVGIGVALIIASGYALFLFVAYAYAAVLAGSGLMYAIRNRRISALQITWRGALLGVIALSILGSIPVIGIVIKVVLAASAGGALLSIFYKFAFRHEKTDLSAF